jgi:hypothetical protein
VSRPRGQTHRQTRAHPHRNEPVRIFIANLKGLELAGLPGDTLAEVTTAAERGIHRIRTTHRLAFSFLRHCGLFLW